MVDDKTRAAVRPVGKRGKWLWKCGIQLPEGQPTEYPICPFCTESPFREPGEALPKKCPTCGATLNSNY